MPYRRLVGETVDVDAWAQWARPLGGNTIFKRACAAKRPPFRGFPPWRLLPGGRNAFSHEKILAYGPGPFFCRHTDTQPRHVVQGHAAVRGPGGQLTVHNPVAPLTAGERLVAKAAVSAAEASAQALQPHAAEGNTINKHD